MKSILVKIVHFIVKESHGIRNFETKLDESQKCGCHERHVANYFIMTDAVIFLT